MKRPRTKKLKFVDPPIHAQAPDELLPLEGPKNPSWSQISRREVRRERKEALRELDKLKDRSLTL